MKSPLKKTSPTAAHPPPLLGDYQVHWNPKELYSPKAKFDERSQSPSHGKSFQATQNDTLPFQHRDTSSMANYNWHTVEERPSTATGKITVDGIKEPVDTLSTPLPSLPPSMPALGIVLDSVPFSGVSKKPVDRKNSI